MQTVGAMFNAKQILITLLQINLYDLCQSTNSPLAGVPNSAVVRTHTTASFECIINSTNFPFWQFLDLSGGTDKYIVVKNGVVNRMISRYRIKKSIGGPYVLMIDHVDRGHAGRYTCVDRDDSASAELTVIDSDPVCGTSTMENDTIIWMWCEINSTGNLIPLMKWTKNNDDIESNTTQSTTINGSTMTTSFVRLQLQPQDNNTMERITVKCTTSFIWKGGSRENIPHYEHVWNHVLNLQSENDAGSTESTPSGEWITAAIGVFSLIVVLILIILCIAFQHRKKSSTERNADENTRAGESQDVAIYAEVNKGTNKIGQRTSNQTKPSSIPAEAHSQNRGPIVGADGTEYMDFSGPKQPESKKVQPKSPEFSQVEIYACVDHTAVAPSHPPSPTRYRSFRR